MVNYIHEARNSGRHLQKTYILIKPNLNGFNQIIHQKTILPDKNKDGATEVKKIECAFCQLAHARK